VPSLLLLTPNPNFRLAGALQYATLTRCDISNAVQQVYLHMHDPRKYHFSLINVSFIISRALFIMVLHLIVFFLILLLPIRMLIVQDARILDALRQGFACI
jgi:hypothetical protein